VPPAPRLTRNAALAWAAPAAALLIAVQSIAFAGTPALAASRPAPGARAAAGPNVAAALQGLRRSGAITPSAYQQYAAVYNAAQRAAYFVLILALVVMILSGLAIWKPVQLQELAALMGGYEGARLLHFFAMSLVVFIVVVHVVMVALVPRTFPTMITGRLRRSS